jgi:alkylation response protein AidB-like acyl-CoA dehydrogenase
MNAEELNHRLAEIPKEILPVPGRGKTAERHRRLFEIGREDLSLAKLAEAHWDALAILAENGREPAPNALYAVWASELPGQPLQLKREARSLRVVGRKMFCSGLGIVDRALVTVGNPDPCLVEIDLKNNANAIEIDTSEWKTEAFRATNTGTITFHGIGISGSIIGEPSWYLHRPGFWHGAIGPAACWAGGAAGLLDAAFESKRDDVHTMAHLAAIQANVWATKTYLVAAGREIDEPHSDGNAAMVPALRIRHLIEQACTDTLRRFARAYGPHPLTMVGETSRRYHELDLYLRQSPAERDLESLGRALLAGRHLG